MSVTTPPRSDAEWARNVEKRINALENPSTARVGSWVLGERGTDLVATAPGQAPVTLNAVPAPARAVAATAVEPVTAEPVAPSTNPIDQIIDAILGGAGDLLDLRNWAKLVPLLTNPLGEGGKLLDSIIPGFDASKIISGFLPPWLFGKVPSGTLTSEQPNRLRNGNFVGNDAIAPAGDWWTDMTTSRTDDDSGSGAVTADGTPHALRTGENPGDKIPVAVGQNFLALGYVRHWGAVVGSGGAAVLLQVVPFTGPNGEIELPPITIATYSPTAPDAPWPGNQISGTWPVADGVTFAQGRVLLTEQALQGGYRLDDWVVTTVVDMNIVPGLPGALQLLNNNWHATLDGLASVARGFPVFGQQISDVVTAFENFNPFNIGGTLGSDLLSGDLFGMIGHIIDAIDNKPAGTTQVGSLADLYTKMNQLAHNTSGSDVMQFVDTTTFVPIDPSWTNWIDAVGVGRGQNGADPGPLPIPGLFGRGGNPGKFNATTWQKGVHYDDTLTGVQVTFNADGSVALSIPGHQVTCQPGSGALGTQFGGGYVGRGPGPYPYNGKPYPGGGDQNQPGRAGVGPGGGGAGGQALFLQDGGPGGPAGAWVRARAEEVEDQSTGADTTGPSAPTTMEVVARTNQSLTLKIAGSIDA